MHLTLQLHWQFGMDYDLDEARRLCASLRQDVEGGSGGGDMGGDGGSDGGGDGADVVEMGGGGSLRPIGPADVVHREDDADYDG